MACDNKKKEFQVPCAPGFSLKHSYIAPRQSHHASTHGVESGRRRDQDVLGRALKQVKRLLLKGAREHVLAASPAFAIQAWVAHRVVNFWAGLVPTTAARHRDS